MYPDSGQKNSLEAGLEFQDFVMEKLRDAGLYMQPYSSKKYQIERGESINGFEIKLDKRIADTHQLSIEIAEKTRESNEEWKPSGIYRNDNTWLYIQGFYGVLWVFSKKYLRIIHKRGTYKEHTEKTVKGFFLPENDANTYCILRLPKRGVFELYKPLTE